MAPTRLKKPKASPTLPTTTMHPTSFTAARSPARTPIASPSRRAAKLGITTSQKQALIDNLQLEVTERARKLRAQYALQAQSLRTRIEMRVNRIPTSLRKANMGELIEKYTQSEAAAVVVQKKEVGPASTISLQQQSDNPRPRPIMPNTIAAPPSPSRGIKRTSDDLASFDQENSTDANSIHVTKPIANKKQRANPTTVLSPKSANSRTVPISPSHRTDFKSPQKSSQLKPQRQPASPLKALASSPSKLSRIGSSSSSSTTAAKPTSSAAGTSLPPSKAHPSQDATFHSPPKANRASKPTAIGGGRTTKAAAAAKSTDIHDETNINAPRTVSSASNASTGTTIVKKKKTTTTATAAGRGKATRKVVKAAVAGKKGVAASAAAVTTSSSTTAGAEEVGTGAGKGGRRVLRKR